MIRHTGGEYPRLRDFFQETTEQLYFSTHYQVCIRININTNFKFSEDALPSRPLSGTSGGRRTSSKYVEVPDNYFPLNTPSIIYFWKPQAKSSSMKMNPTIMIMIRNLRRIEDILHVWWGSWQQCFTCGVKYSIIIFLGSSSKIHFNKDNPNLHDNHQEPQLDGGCLLSIGRFQTTIAQLSINSSSNSSSSQVKLSWGWTGPKSKVAKYDI